MRQRVVRADTLLAGIDQLSIEFMQKRDPFEHRKKNFLDWN
jgi:hypothetical protein